MAKVADWQLEQCAATTAACSTSLQHSNASPGQLETYETGCCCQPLSAFTVSDPQPSLADSESSAHVHPAGFYDLADFYLFKNTFNSDHDPSLAEVDHAQLHNITHSQLQ